MRGKLGLLAKLIPPLGITPADAGKTSHEIVRHRLARDHPRGCGENPEMSFLISPFSGSPPRMRGKRKYAHAVTLEEGITPADAGKTVVKKYFAVNRQDHPRGCGENPPA